MTDTNPRYRRKPKIDKGAYPVAVINRFEVRHGKFGAYFFDHTSNMAIDLNHVLDKLNLYELRKAQLRWYVETYGEVFP